VSDNQQLKDEFDRIYSDESLNPDQRLGQAIAAISDQFCRETGGTHADYIEVLRQHYGGPS